MSVEHGDALLNAAAIHLELGFAGTARPDAAAQAREIRARADEIGLTVPQLRELDLELALTAARVAREHVEDQHGAVHDWNRNDLFQVLALARADVVEHQQHLRVERLGQFGDLARFARSDQRRGIHRIALLYDALDDRSARCLGQRLEFQEFGLERTPRVVRIHGDDDGAGSGFRYDASGTRRSISHWSPSV